MRSTQEGESTCADAMERVQEIKIKFAQNPPEKGKEMSAFRAEIADFSPEWRGLMLGCLTLGNEIGMSMERQDKRQAKQQALYSSLGFVLMLIGAALAFLKSDLSADQSNVVCLLLSAGVASFLVFLPGFLKLAGTMSPNSFFDSVRFQAGGGFALFILTFTLLKAGLKI